MPHIKLPEGVPGIRSLFAYRPETAVHMSALVQLLLHDPHPGLSAGERELIATYVSRLNTCKYCTATHGSIARHQLESTAEMVEQVLTEPDKAPISEKLKALLRIAASVQSDAKSVRTEDIQAARRHGATDIDIHDTVLIAAAFCMYNRYVDGLATWQPDDPALYDQIGEQRARDGYVNPSMKADRTTDSLEML